MATTSGPDLSAAVRAVTALMDDTCVITRGSDKEDLILDRTTGALVDPETPGTVYAGRCKVRPSGGSYGETGDVSTLTLVWEGAIPAESDAVILEGDTWTHTSSRRDPQLVDAVFRVKEVVTSSFRVQRKVVLERQS